MERNNSSLVFGNEIAAIAGGSILFAVVLLSLIVFQSTGAILLLAIVLGVLYTIGVFRSAKFGFYSYYTFTYWLFQLNLYTGVTQSGVLADILLLLNVFIILLTQYYNQEIDKPIYTYKSVWIWLVWLIVPVAINILNGSEVTWLSFVYGVRRFYLNPLGLVFLNILVIKTKKDFYQFLKITAFFSVVTILVGYRQLYLGFNAAENRLLATEFGTTHLIQGSIRYWSTFSDAAAYGVGMSLFTVVAVTYALIAKTKRVRNLSILIALLLAHQVLISGTRSAFASLGVGLLLAFAFYLRGRARFISLSISALAYALIRFTFIGHNFAVIRRLRTSLNPDDLSLVVRIQNRALLSNWLDERFFGGGIGSTQFDRRFNPGSFLSTFPPDGLYVLFRAELGYIGEYVFLLLSVLIIIYILYMISKTNPFGERRIWMVTVLALFASARLSDYAQVVTFQFPLVNMLFFMLVALEKWPNWQERIIFHPKDKAPFQ